jgi:excisionase family DNA binding protein
LQPRLLPLADEVPVTGIELLTTLEVAALLRVHPKHVFRLLKQGLPGRRAGSKWLFDRDEVLAWASARGTAPATVQRVAEPAVARPASPTAASQAQAPPPLVAANGDILIERLLAALHGAGGPLVGFVQADREQARHHLDDRAVLAAGYHGDVPVERHLSWMHLARRDIGLCTRGKKLSSLGQLRSLPAGRLISRPPTAGVRAHLDAALEGSGIDAVQVHARATIAAAHRDVVSAVARGDADVGLVTRAWASLFGLAFYSVASEPYGLLLATHDLGTPALASLCGIAQSRTYRTLLREVPGYDPRHAGELRVSP